MTTDNLNFIYFSRYETGHRKDYMNFCDTYLGGQKSTNLYKEVFFNKKIFFLMIEEMFLVYVLISVIRNLIGLNTYGMTFRANTVFNDRSIRSSLKKFLMSILKKLKRVKTISIIPFYIDERLENVCDGWIYDFQFWDMKLFEDKYKNSRNIDFEQKILKISNGRKIVSALGKQSIVKGFEDFCDKYQDALKEDYLFISAGEIIDIDKINVEHYKESGVHIINRKISNQELFSLYSISNFIWGCYKPNYDQSSGILGRALQFKKPIIVRKNSVAEKICISENSAHISIDLDINPKSLKRELDYYSPSFKPYNKNIFRQKSLKYLNKIDLI
jgi:hypothetical protein